MWSLRKRGIVRTVATDLGLIGAGSCGLSVAAAAAQMGARVVLVEQGRMGGDCLNYGCVPSKALIAAAAAADGLRHAGRFGGHGHDPAVDFLGLRAHRRGVNAVLSPPGFVERLRETGRSLVRDRGWERV